MTRVFNTAQEVRLHALTVRKIRADQEEANLVLLIEAASDEGRLSVAVDEISLLVEERLLGKGYAVEPANGKMIIDWHPNK